jgi:hypothetical protein
VAHRTTLAAALRKPASLAIAVRAPDLARTRPHPVRFWVEAGLGLLSAILLVLTMFVPNWIEVVVRVDPDHGNSALEWAIVAVLSVTTIATSVLARREWRCGRDDHGPSVVEQVVSRSVAGGG